MSKAKSDAVRYWRYPSPVPWEGAENGMWTFCHIFEEYLVLKLETNNAADAVISRRLRRIS